jgi:hypothetical protein
MAGSSHRSRAQTADRAAGVAAGAQRRRNVFVRFVQLIVEMRRERLQRQTDDYLATLDDERLAELGYDPHEFRARRGIKRRKVSMT